MEIELNFGALFSLINGIISIANILLLAMTVKRHTTKKDSGVKNSHDNLVPKAQLQADQEVETALAKKEIVTELVDHGDLQVEDNAKPDVKRCDVLMSKATEDRLLQDFEKAKEQQFFLKKGICLTDLAKMLGTNQRYVSYILNTHAGMDFNNFVQKSRVEHLIALVEEHPDLLNNKFSVLAEKVGFSSISKFSSVFKAIKGMPPSEYFHQCRIAG